MDEEIINFPDTSQLIEQIAKIKLRLMDQEMINLKKVDKSKHQLQIEKEFFDFFDQYPSIFKVVYDDVDLTILAEMLGKIEDIKKGLLTKKVAEEQLGQTLANKYLYPVFPKK